MQRVEERERARLLDGGRRAEAQRRRQRSTRARRLRGVEEGECQRVSRHVGAFLSDMPER